MKTKTLFKKIFRPKLYDKEMREKLLGLFEELLEDDNEVNSIVDISNEYDVDDLLDKINHYGIESLTDDELNYLNNQ